MVTGYRRGADLERRTKRWLEARKYYVVRSAGSKGLCDLVAVSGHRTGRMVFLQCKRSGKISPRELRDFQELIERIHGAEGYVVRGGRTLEAREILFWERNEWEPISNVL